MDEKSAHRSGGATEVGASGPASRSQRRDDERYDERRGTEATEASNSGHRDVTDRHLDHRPTREDEAREKFGGLNWGACFFGWLVAVAVAVLLTSIVGAVVAAVGSSTDVTQSEAQRQAGDIGLLAAIVLLGVLVVGYFLGGYVAGRMSRFDGGRQGLGVWLFGLVITILAIALGAIFGSQYNLLNRVSLPNLPISSEQLGWGAVITALAVLLGTMLAALLGGKVGHRYHDRVDRKAWG